MNAERLLALYEKVAEAPDAIARLRRFILDLAVRGKLVDQDPTDEPASELLKRIAAERARLVKAGEIRNPKPLDPVVKVPFAIPRDWAWTRLGAIAAYIQRGKSPKYAPAEGAPVISQKCVQWAGLDLGSAKQITLESLAKYEPIRFLRDGDLLWNSTGTGTIGRIIRLSDPPDQLVCDSHVTVVRCLEVDPEYVRTWLRTDHVYGLIEDRAAGSTNQVELTAQMANTQPVPLPPLAEQRRIVAKVEELMALLDRLEAARTAREAARDRLTAASLARLTAPDADAPGVDPGVSLRTGAGFASGSATIAASFPADARFALDTLPALTTRPDQIKPLRQTILNLAVRGKLVDQDPTDEPLPRIDKGLSLESAAPFDIPNGWQWSRLRALGTLKGGGTPSKARGDFWNGHIPWVSPKDMKVDCIEAAQLSITDAAVAGSAVNLIGPESILFVVRGMILAHSFPVAISKVPVTINQDMKAIILKKPEMAEYILRALKGLTPEMLARVQRSSHGTCRIEGSDYGDFLIPLPPLAEQHRIVAKVDALMALCDRLEAALATAAATRARLLEALLHEALEPAAEAVTEAAE